MKAIVLTGIRTMEEREMDAPRVERDTDVLLRVRSVGVCGSDVHYYVEGRIGGSNVTYPHIVGHEFGATVEAIGPAVRGLRAGQLVAVDPNISCGQCEQCRAGREHTCLRQVFRSSPGQADGCLCEYIVMPAHCCVAVPDGLSAELAALSEPLSIGIYAVSLCRGDVTVSRIAILGCGPIGLCVLAAARALGAVDVAMTDRVPERIALARARGGAAWSGTPEALNAAVTAGAAGPFDIVIECCGRQEALDQALELLRPGGQLLIVGIPSERRVSFNVDVMRRKEIAIQNVRRQNHCVGPALELIARNQIDVTYMITHRFALEQTQEAFDTVAAYRDGVLKAMVHIA